MVEYWVTIREHGSYEEELDMKEMHKSTSKAAMLFAMLFANADLISGTPSDELHAQQLQPNLPGTTL